MTEKSLYFGHFLKVVDNEASQNRRMWINLRKLKGIILDILA